MIISFLVQIVSEEYQGLGEVFKVGLMGRLPEKSHKNQKTRNHKNREPAKQLNIPNSH
jgi:hypothetical protein